MGQPAGVLEVLAAILRGVLMSIENIRPIQKNATQKNLRIGFLATRLQGTDGVSLETRKWSDMLQELGHSTFFFAGHSNWEAERTRVIPQAYFRDPEVYALHTECFQRATRRPELSLWMDTEKRKLKKEIYAFVKDFQIDVVIPQNILAIPVHIPLGLAVTEFLLETGMPCIAHHHDFYWERVRFLENCIGDYLGAAFPPELPNVQHVVINSLAQRQLARHRGLSSSRVPNVMSFRDKTGSDRANSVQTERIQAFRKQYSLSDDTVIVLQPTRVIQRKGIELAIEFVHRLGRPACLVVSHSSGDEGDEYSDRLHHYAERLGVHFFSVADHVEPDGVEPGITSSNNYSLQEMYDIADVVSYPSLYEGFGNALIEAVYFRKPVLVNAYPVYQTDIRPRGFQFCEMDGFLKDEHIARMLSWMDDRKARDEMTAHNYALGAQFFSYEVLQYKLQSLLANVFGVSS